MELRKKYNFVLDKYPNVLHYKFYVILSKEPCAPCKSISCKFVKQKTDNLYALQKLEQKIKAEVHEKN